MDMKKAIYLIESGKALDLVKQHIAHRIRIRKEGIALLAELGCQNNPVWTDRMTGVITCISAKRGQQPEGFTMPDSKGRTWPKKGTAAAKRFADQRGYPAPTSEIARAFNVPLHFDYTSNDGSTGSRRIGFPLRECGYLYMGEDGPFALWIPDVKQIVADCEAQGDTVTCDAKAFDMVLEGCRRIELEEWDIMVMQHKLDEKRRQKEMVGAA